MILESHLFLTRALFFDEYKPDGDDACISGKKQDMRVICEFTDLPNSIIIDADHPTTLEQDDLAIAGVEGSCLHS